MCVCVCVCVRVCVCVCVCFAYGRDAVAALPGDDREREKRLKTVQLWKATNGHFFFSPFSSLSLFK